MAKILFFLCLILVPSLANNKELSCENNSFDASGYVCNNHIASETQCTTFAVLHTNSYYSSLYNLSIHLGLNRFAIAEANGFSEDTEFLPKDQPLLIPIDCKCTEAGYYEAPLIKTTEKAENFRDIAESLEGLTTCKAIKERNVDIPPDNLAERIKINVPVRCACPSSSEISSGIRLLITYPVITGDYSVTSLATQFNISPEIIMTVNNRSGNAAVVNNPLSLLVPLKEKPLLGSLIKPSEPGLGFPSQRSVETIRREKKKKKKRKLRLILGVCIGVIGFAVIVTIMGIVAFFLIKKRKQDPRNLSAKMVDVELQKLSLSIRTTSEKKVSFEGSQCTLDGQALDQVTTPRNKIMLENYTTDELKKATEDFDSHNLIEGKVYHGRLKGKNLAIMCTTSEFLSRVDLTLFQDSIHNHPNIIRVLGSCVNDDDLDSYLVFEYAKNGSLKDWIHGGLAMKSHFISSCSCLLSWTKRLRICLDVALALQYMHHIMHPVYVHRNIKSRNIFLDDEFNAKVGNFGLAKCVESETEQDNTTEFCSRNPASWSKGYLAPEYIKDGTVSPSIDVFAYGVVLLEVLSGETPVICQKDGEIVMLTEKIKSILHSDNAEELRGWMDADLAENYSFDGAITLANLARSCIDDNPSLRPSAGEIVEKLSRLVEESPDDRFLFNESCSKPLVQAAKSKH